MSKKRIGIILALTGILISGVVVIAPTTQPSQQSSPLSPQMKYFDELISSIGPEVLASEYDAATVIVDPTLEGKGWTKDSTSNLTTSLKLMRYFGYSPVYPIRIFISWEPTFRNKNIPSYCDTSGGGGYCGAGIMFANVKWWTDMWRVDDETKSKYPDETDKLSFIANLPHEIGHVLHESAKYKTESQDINLQPAWLREGSADFFKLATYSIQNDIPYSTLRTQTLKYWKYCQGVKLETLTSQGSSESGCEYTNGVVAVEYLLWKTRSLDSLFTFVKTPGVSQDEIFQNAFGLDQTSFQKEADEYFVSSTANIPSNL
jgi:hypothetical protein